MDIELYGKIELNYDKIVYLPVDKALELLRLLAQGEYSDESYGKKNEPLVGIPKDMRLSIITEQEYKERKLANVLDTP